METTNLNTANLLETSSIEKFIGYDSGKLLNLIRESLDAPGTNPIKESILQKNLDDIYNKLQLDKTRKTSRKLLTINEVLNFEQESTLRSAYPEFDFVFTHTTVNGHAVAAASRVCETETCLKKTHFKDDKPIIDIGGNFYYHFKNSRSAVHCDCPILTVRDAQRWSSRIESVSSYSKELTEAQKLIIDDLQTVTKTKSICRPAVCARTVQECSYRAKSAIAIHSLYDIPMIELLESMNRRDIDVLLGTMIFDSKMLFLNHGKIDAINAHYQWNYDTNEITFTFIDDNSLTYTHAFDNYIKYFVTPYARVGDHDFIIELQENRLGVQYIKITRVPKVQDTPGEEISVRHWMTSLKNKKIIKFFSLPEDDKELSWFQVFFGAKEFANRQEIFFCDAELVERGKDFAFRATDKFKPLEIYNYMQSLNRRVFVGGKEIMHREVRESAETLFKVANAIYIEVFCKKYNIGQILSQLKNSVEYNRGLIDTTLFEKIFISINKRKNADSRYGKTLWSRLHRKFFYRASVRLPPIEKEYISNLTVIPIDVLCTNYSETAIDKLIYDPVEYVDTYAKVRNYFSAFYKLINRDRSILKFDRPVETGMPIDIYRRIKMLASGEMENKIETDLTNIPDLRYHVLSGLPDESYKSQFFGAQEFTICPIITKSYECQIKCFLRAHRAKSSVHNVMISIKKAFENELFSVPSSAIVDVINSYDFKRKTFVRSPSLNLLKLLKQIYPVSFVIHNEITRNYYTIGVVTENSIHLLYRDDHVDLLLPRANEYEISINLDDYINSMILGKNYQALLYSVILSCKNRVELLIRKLKNLYFSAKQKFLQVMRYIRQLLFKNSVDDEDENLWNDTSVDDLISPAVIIGEIIENGTPASEQLRLIENIVEPTFDCDIKFPVSCSYDMNECCYPLSDAVLEVACTAEHSEEIASAQVFEPVVYMLEEQKGIDFYEGWKNWIYENYANNLDIDSYRNYWQCRIFYNKAAYKLFEINTRFNIFDSRVQSVLDMCGAPGGFAQVCRLHNCDYESFSLGDYRINYGEIKNCNIDDFVPNKLYDLVLGDGAVDNSYSDDSIFVKELNLIGVCLKSGCDAVLKHSNYFELKVKIANGSYPMFKNFSKIFIFKPKLSYDRSSECYVVLKTFGQTVCEIEDLWDFDRLSRYRIRVENFVAGRELQYKGPEDIIRELELPNLLPNRTYNTTYCNDADLHRLLSNNCNVDYTSDIVVLSEELLSMYPERKPNVSNLLIFSSINTDPTKNHIITTFFDYVRGFYFQNRRADWYVRNKRPMTEIRFDFDDRKCVGDLYNVKDTKLDWNWFEQNADTVFARNYDYHYILNTAGVYYFCYGSFEIGSKYSTSSDEKYRNFELLYSRKLGEVKLLQESYYSYVYTCITRLSMRGVDGIISRMVKTSPISSVYFMLEYGDVDEIRKNSACSYIVSIKSMETIKTKLKKNFSNIPSILVSADIEFHESTISDLFADIADTVYYRRFDQDENYIDTVGLVRNSIKEVREMWSARLNAVCTEFKSVYDGLKLTNFVGDPTAQHIGVIDVTTNVWKKKPSVKTDAEYTVCYDGTGIKPISANSKVIRSVCPIQGRYVLVSSRVEMLIESTLLEKTKELENVDVVRSIGQFVLYTGAPGSGKTTAILSGMDRGDRTTLGDICVTANRDTVTDLRERAKRVGFMDDTEILKRKFRTFESLLINSRDTCETLWVDEAYMRPPGQIFMCALLVKAKRVCMYGDFAQIPFINRDRFITLRYNDFKQFTWQTITREHTYRCPRDVVALINDGNYYPFKITGSNAVMNSLQPVKFFKTVSEISKNDKTKYLTYIQDDKTTLKQLGFQNVSTIHEFQGEENPSITLIRITTKNYEVHESPAHLLVALTRHTKSFTYCTTVKDKMVKMIEKSRYLDKNVYYKIINNTAGNNVPFEFSLAHGYSVKFGASSKLARDIVFSAESHDTKHASPQPEYFLPGPVNVIGPTDFGPSLGKEYLQMVYDDIFPGLSVDDREYDQMNAEMVDANFSDCKFSISPQPISYLKDSYNLKPYLRTAIQADVQTTPQAVIHAYSERNGGAPDYLGEINADYVTNCVAAFEELYIRDHNLYQSFAENVININSESIDDWFSGQKPAVRNMIGAEELDLMWHDLQVYEFMLKRNAKPVLDETAVSKLTAPQTIAYHKKIVNAVFCPIVREVKKRMMSVIGNNVLVFTDMSLEDFEHRLNTFFPPSNLKLFKYIKEIDFSKFDKSQWDKVIYVEVALLIKFGFPPEWAQLWIYMYYHTVLINHATGFNAKINFQRKSGSPMTFMGNTWFSMVTLAVVIKKTGLLNRKLRIFMMFSGDDIYIFSTEYLDIDMKDFELLFNLEAKLLHYDSQYFCSKFLIPVSETRWRVVPDLVKILTKLGRRDLVNYQHANEYRISLCDLLSAYAVENDLHIFECYMRDRYKVNMGFESVIATLIEYTSSENKFKELFFEPNMPEYIKKFKNINRPLPSLDI